jgi:hypothetical protein
MLAASRRNAVIRIAGIRECLIKVPFLGVIAICDALL